MSDLNQESSTEDKPKAKPGPKPKAKIDVEKELIEFKQRYQNLEQLVLELALHSGYNALVRKNHFTPLVANPQKKYQN